MGRKYINKEFLLINHKRHPPTTATTTTINDNNNNNSEKEMITSASDVTSKVVDEADSDGSVEDLGLEQILLCHKVKYFQ